MRLGRCVRSDRIAAALIACACIASCSPYDAGALRAPDSGNAPGTDGDASTNPMPGHDGGHRDGGPPVIVGGGGPDAGRIECDADPMAPTCTRMNALTACVDDKCLLVQCKAPWVDCNGDSDDGCEARLDSTDNCGICGATCELANAEVACDSGKCAFHGCKEAWGDCDANPGNGCETSLRSLDDCGKCGATCDAPAHAAPGCETGSCGVGQCIGTFGDCDHKPGNGCEQALVTLDDCGGCDSACAPAHATGDCATGSCTIKDCVDPNVDCNGRVGDGCEAQLDTAAHCGDCATSCELTAHATSVVCATGNKCEVDHHCPSGLAGCVEDAPVTGCEPGFGDCNGDGADGCERALDSLTDCGECDTPCAMTNAITSCDSGSCEFVDCLPGYDRCGGNTCISLANDEDNCGECEFQCAGGTANCAGGKCTGQTCGTGTADCNGMAGDGCEASLDDVQSCGLCGLHCGPYPHATAGCTTGRCRLTDCDPGFEDCDGAVSNGCEVPIHTLDHCGSCDATCAIAFASESCSSGDCKFVKCDAGRADCDDDLANGCETNLLLPDNCGKCGLDCRALPNVLSGGCTSEAMCEFVCKAGFADCDGKPENGCEVNVASAQNCGGCDSDCTQLPNVVSSSCDGTLCTDLKCKDGFGDCDGIAGNGCERAIDTLTDCGACNKPCAPAHAAGACNAGACQVTSCDSGYDDCNKKADDGCEASLNEADTCGTCSNHCNEGMHCDNGECACTESSQCAATNVECCDNRCVDTYSVCSWAPCIPGMPARSIVNCGYCGGFCPVDLPGAVFCCGLD
jgi:hypothetical protein